MTLGIHGGFSSMHVHYIIMLNTRPHL